MLKSKEWRDQKVWEICSGDKNLREYWQLARLMCGRDDHCGKHLSKSCSKVSRERAEKEVKSNVSIVGQRLTISSM